MLARKSAALFSLGFGTVVACSFAVGCSGSAGDEGAASHTAEALSYTPMGFARVASSGAVVTGYDSASGGVSVAHTAGSGQYTVSFGSLAAGWSGNVQVSGEGTDSARCRVLSWSPSGSTQQVYVQCNRPDGSAADAAFAVLFYTEVMPAPNTYPTNTAYAWVSGNAAPAAYNYNSSGHLNTVAHNGAGDYTVTIPQAGFWNASAMVTAYGGSGAPFCQVGSWGTTGTGVNVNVKCWSTTGAPADGSFSISYASSGPVLGEQSAHAWFDGTGANSYYSGAQGKLDCSSTSVTGSRTGSNASVVVSGDIGAWTASPFVRASFVSGYGASPAYCKVTSLVSVEGAPSTSTTHVTCFDGTGAVIATPTFTFTQTTSDDSGPC
jgi:hypothetical protein